MFSVVCGILAAACLAAGLARGDLAFGIGGSVGMLVYGAILLALRRRSEPIALLSGNPADERQAQVMMRATAFTGQLLTVVLVAGAIGTTATGSDYANVFWGLCSLAGLSFIAATVWYSRRG